MVSIPAVPSRATHKPGEKGDGGKVLEVSVALIRQLHEERFGAEEGRVRL